VGKSGEKWFYLPFLIPGCVQQEAITIIKMHFRGINNISIDAKGRMAMPARYRERLLDSCGGRLVVTVDRDSCLLVYPLPEWEVIENKLIALPSLNKQARLLQRLIIGHATELEMDGQGRILLPSMLRDYADLQKKAVLIGQGKKLEIWDETTWNESQQEWLAEVQADNGELPAALEELSL
jgi:MraZ protein